MPAVHVAYVVHVPDDNDATSYDVQITQLQLRTLMDSPMEPPVDIATAQLMIPILQRPSKKRCCNTISSILQGPTEMCELEGNIQRAMEETPPENPKEFFIKYMMQNLNSQNYPDGLGLPSRWGTF
ncbi:male-specific protein scotti-like [Scaptodrosophila lebanonensis]|uniref:Male-specific protein scotti n=1 Tax=Drosophila lebanonensis TaxID=7225 RepID=A0A6J2T2T9_DROLE|nr:male-specific protein scotti-like [Scaptodrosophila lebanonensis]